MIGLSNHLLSKVFRFHYHSEKVIGSLGNDFLHTCKCKRRDNLGYSNDRFVCVCCLLHCYMTQNDALKKSQNPPHPHPHQQKKSKKNTQQTHPTPGPDSSSKKKHIRPPRTSTRPLNGAPPPSSPSTVRRFRWLPQRFKALRPMRNIISSSRLGDG